MAKVLGKRRIAVLGSEMSYIDTRAGEHLILFLHGNPTSSYMWRNVIPLVQGMGRCLAPDLIGMGDSGKPTDCQYTIGEHIRYLDAWIDALQLDENRKIILVGHEWGAALAIDWYRRHPIRVESIIHMEGILGVFNSVNDLGSPSVVNAIKSILDVDNNAELEKTLGKRYLDMCIDEMMTYKPLKKNNIEMYLKPFSDNVKPLTALVKQLPIKNVASDDVIERVKVNCDWMGKQSDISVLHCTTENGRLSKGNTQVTKNWKQIYVELPGGHFVSEGAQQQLGAAIVAFIRNK